MTVFHFLFFEWTFPLKEKSEQRKPATKNTTDKHKLIHYVHITTTVYSIFNYSVNPEQRNLVCYMHSKVSGNVISAAFG